jgi:NADPH2:quinone reductase
VTVIGLLSGPPIIQDFNLMSQLGENVKISFCKSGVIGTRHYCLQETPINLVAESIANNKMKSLRAKTFMFHEISEAHNFMESNKANGKIVVVI